jgi:hypothetical protein
LDVASISATPGKPFIWAAALAFAYGRPVARRRLGLFHTAHVCRIAISFASLGWSLLTRNNISRDPSAGVPLSWTEYAVMQSRVVRITWYQAAPGVGSARPVESLLFALKALA